MSEKKPEKKNEGFTAEERAALKARAKELKSNATKAEQEAQVVAAIAELSQPDRGIGEKLHAIVKAAAPELSGKLWYGMPAWALDGKVLVHFQPADKFGTRYPTIGFSDIAKLDDGDMWPAAYALTKLGAAEEKAITALLKKAVG